MANGWAASEALTFGQISIGTKSQKQNVATRVAVGTFRLEGNAPGSVQMTA